MKKAKTVIFFLFVSFIFNTGVFPQNKDLKIYTVKKAKGKIVFDGILNEPFWNDADSINGLTMVEPTEGSLPSKKTVVKILANEEKIFVGVVCYDNPNEITAFSKGRDQSLYSEDYVKFVFDTYCDKRNGYIFAVNPLGARYDALVANRGEDENSRWDGVWDAKTFVGNFGWSAEIIISVKALSFKKDLTYWGFNIERKIQRFMEKDRWTALKRNYNVTSLFKEGIIKNLPRFNLGWGLLARISPIAGFRKEYGKKINFTKDLSGDFTQRLSSDVSATVTINTDFAETEVDSRRTNLTRFPLFFPEKRTFFLEGADIFDFGLGLDGDLVPFFSRRIGLYKGREVPIIWGTKLTGKLGNTNFGGLFVRTNKVENLVPATNLGVVRIKQNIWEQSNVGIIATYGDPRGIKNSWLLGADFTYQISDLFGDKNFLIGLWGMYANRPDLSGNKSTYGFKVDYPNDLFDISLNYRFIGDAFIPSLGYVPRPGIKYYRIGFDYMPRPKFKLIRQYYFESSWRLITGLDNKWQSYSVFTAPVHFRLESGDRFEFNFRPTGERLTEPFEIEKGVVIPPGEYNWKRFRIEIGTASKRKISGQATWWFGSFYTGLLDQIEFWLSAKLTSNIIFEFNYEKNIVALKEGSFVQQLLGTRIKLNFSPNAQLISFIQYDNESNSIGTNTRFRWTITPLTDLFVVYNHNVKRLKESPWQFDSNEFVVKLSYGIWH